MLVIAAFPHAPRWWRVWGAAGAGLILLGLLVPLDEPGTDLANFIGHVIWSVWLVALAWLLVRRRLVPDRMAPAMTREPAPPPTRA